MLLKAKLHKMSFPRKKSTDEANKSLDPDEAKKKITAYCVYQERCQKEVRDKLYSYGLSSEEVEKQLTAMILEGFLNEERFARAFSRGKFRLKKWGRVRIRKELQLRLLTENCIALGMQEIDEQEYMDTLTFLAERKSLNTIEKDPLIKRKKLNQYLVYKGFESDVIRETIDQLMKNQRGDDNAD